MRNLTHFPDDDPRTRTLATRMADPDRNARLNAIPDTDFDTLPLKALADKHDLPDLDPIETASVIGPRLDAKVKRAREEDARIAANAAKASRSNPLQVAQDTNDPVRAQNFDRAQSAPTGGLPNPGAGLRQGTVTTDSFFGKAPEAGRPPSPGTRAIATSQNASSDLNLGGNRKASGPSGIGGRFAGGFATSTDTATPPPAPTFGTFFLQQLEQISGRSWDDLVARGQDVIAAALRPQSVLQGNLPVPAPEDLPRTAPPPGQSFRAAQDAGLEPDSEDSRSGGIAPLAVIPLAEFTPDAIEALKSGLEVFETFIEGIPPEEEFAIIGPGGEGSPDRVKMSEGLKLLVEFTPIGAAFGVAKAYVDYRRAIANGDTETARAKAIELLTEIGTSLTGPIGRGAKKTLGAIDLPAVGKRLQRVVRKLKFGGEVEDVWKTLDRNTRRRLNQIGRGAAVSRTRDAVIHVLKDAKNITLPGRPPLPNFEKPGGLKAAKRDFKEIIEDAGHKPSSARLLPEDRGPGEIIELPEGTKIIWRQFSRDGRPTVEIQVRNNVDILKIRYILDER